MALVFMKLRVRPVRLSIAPPTLGQRNAQLFSVYTTPVVTRMDTLKSGRTHYVYYTTRFARVFRIGCD